MGIDAAAVFATDMAASLGIPLHYDSPKDEDRVKPVDFVRYASSLGLQVKVIEFGESSDL